MGLSLYPAGEPQEQHPLRSLRNVIFFSHKMHCLTCLLLLSVFLCTMLHNLSHLAVDNFVNRHHLELVTICFAILGVTISNGGALEMEKEMIITKKIH